MIRQSLRSRPLSRTAFTLVEVLVAVGVLTIILFVIMEVIGATGRAWNGAVARTESFQNARAAFESLTRLLAQATLNTYYQVTYDGGGTPSSYRRGSDLEFVSGTGQATGLEGQIGHAVFFQAPLGYTENTANAQLSGALNTCGFYLHYSRDTLRPAFLEGLLGANSNPPRFRLEQVLEPSENFSVYKYPAAGDHTWLTAAAATSSHLFAVNVVAFALVPEDPAVQGGTAATSVLANSYDYDSRSAANTAVLNQLPPVLEVFMAAIDESSALKICTSDTAPSLGQGVLFQDPAKLEGDIAALDAVLSAAPGNLAANTVPLTHRFFRSKVILEGAKWSN